MPLSSVRDAAFLRRVAAYPAIFTVAGTFVGIGALLGWSDSNEPGNGAVALLLACSATAGAAVFWWVTRSRVEVLPDRLVVHNTLREVTIPRAAIVGYAPRQAYVGAYHLRVCHVVDGRERRTTVTALSFGAVHDGTIELFR